MPEIAASQPSSSGAITIAGREIPVRVCLVWACVAIWIGNMILHTGSAGITALWTSLLFLTQIIVITSATRTVSLDQVATFYCLGGAMMTVVWLIDHGITMIGPDGNAERLFAPFLEESLKLAPVVFFLWHQRRARSRTCGASDLLLLAAASGSGNGLVEDATLQHRFGLWHPVSWFPTTAVSGASLTAGHQIWTSIAGATLGLALLWRPRKPFAYLLGASGFLLAAFDHFRNNFSVSHSGFVVDLLNFIGGHGWNALYLFVLGVILVVASDLYVLRGTLPRGPELKTPPMSGGLGGVNRAWRFLLRRRELAYLMFKSRRVTGPLRAEMILQANALDQSLTRLHALASGPTLHSQADQ